MKINCIIVEDEPLALDRIKKYIQKLPTLQLLSEFNNGIDAHLFLQSNNVDLIFLDINIGDFSGIQLLESMHIASQVIITTAYHEFALKGFELNVSDYLLKPYTFERFLQAVDRVHKRVRVKEPHTESKFIFIKTEYRLEKLFLSDILFIEGMRDYRKIHTLNTPLMTLQTFKEFEQEIPARILSRVHKSYMVSLDKIENIEKDEIKIREFTIPISETYKKVFFELIH